MSLEINVRYIFFSIWVFFQEHSRITGVQGKGEGISLTPHSHFTRFRDTWPLAGRLLQRAHLCTYLVTGLEPRPLVSERKSLTTNFSEQITSQNRWQLPFTNFQKLESNADVACKVFVCRSYTCLCVSLPLRVCVCMYLLHDAIQYVIA